MTLSEARGEAAVDWLCCAIVCLLLACQTPPANTPQKDSDEIDVESKKEVDPRKVAAANKAFRRIPIPERLGCGIERTQAIRSDAALADLLRATSGYEMGDFQSRLEGASISFERETLLLLQYNASGGDIRVRFGVPSLFKSLWPSWPSIPRVLTLHISAVSSGMAGSATHVLYCYAVVVDRSLVDMVVLNVNDEAVFAMAFDELSPYEQPATGAGR